MKTITITDTHGRDGRMNINIDEYDLMVFDGDYVDSYDKSNDEIYDNLKAIIQLKKTYPDKVILLLGNHDVNYMIHTNYTQCSGFRPEAFHDLRELFHNNLGLFNVAHQIGNYIWSHAGIHRGWYDHSALGQIIELGLDKEEYSIADQINGLFNFNKDSVFDVGYRRGGFKPVGGPLWCDKQLSHKKPLDGYHQIVGHTPVKEITTIEYKAKSSAFDKDTSITYCDCLETKEEFYELEI